MTFVSLTFFAFFLIVFLGYWTMQNVSQRLQNIFLLVASYIFYAWGDRRFLAILIANSAVTYALAQAIQKNPDLGHKKAMLFISIAFGLGTLGFFKYFNFFTDSVVNLLGVIGLRPDIHTLRIILPLGISYFTFKSLSYVIEVYRGKFRATDDYVAYFAYVGFFPQLVAGPIDRPSNLLTQIEDRREFVPQAIYLGMKQAVWGMFKKVVIGDNLQVFVNSSFSDYTSKSGESLMIAAILFSIQIYCDFSGYSDMANGFARMLGFRPMENFAQPYFSRDIAEFWRRWHISLSSWFRDYVFYPLGGGIGSKWKAIRNTLITFTLSGLWHGANWTYVFWGFLHGLLFIPLILGVQATHVKKIAYKRLLPSLPELSLMLFTFGVVTLSWIFFRADSLSDALSYLFRMTSAFHFALPEGKQLFILSALMISAEWITRGRTSALDLKLKNRLFRWSIYSIVLICILLKGNFNENPFIYANY